MKNIELAFDTGDTIYFVNEFLSVPRIEEYKVDSITIRPSVIEFWFIKDGQENYFDGTHLGEYIFQTRAEAEKRLSELKAEQR